MGGFFSVTWYQNSLFCEYCGDVTNSSIWNEISTWAYLQFGIFETHLLIFWWWKKSEKILDWKSEKSRKKAGKICENRRKTDFSTTSSNIRDTPEWIYHPIELYLNCSKQTATNFSLRFCFLETLEILVNMSIQIRSKYSRQFANPTVWVNYDSNGHSTSASLKTQLAMSWKKSKFKSYWKTRKQILYTTIRKPQYTH